MDKIVPNYPTGKKFPPETFVKGQLASLPSLTIIDCFAFGPHFIGQIKLLWRKELF